MKTKDGKWRYASRDLFKVNCNHCTTLDMAVAANVPEALEIHEKYLVDLDLVLPIRQGNEYEAMVFRWLKDELGEDFMELERASMDETLTHLRAGVPVVAQGFFENWTNGHFWSGYADLLVREDYDVVGTPEGKITILKSNRVLEAPKYVVWDVKCSKTFKEYYWIQLASYAEILNQNNLGSALDLGIIGVRGILVRFSQASGLAKLTSARNRLIETLDSVSPSEMTFSDVPSLHCHNKVTCEDLHCSYPQLCKIGILAEDPLSQIYDFRSLKAYQEAGFQTLHQLASSEGHLVIGKLSQEKINEHRLWARVVERERLTGEPQIDILDQKNWLPLPEPDASDLFFDIEWFTPVNAESDSVFMFGVVDSDEQFTVFESLDLTSEKALFEEFVAYALQKMKSSDAAHIYHYYNPEPRYLLKLSKFYKTLEEEVEFLVSRMIDLRDIAISRVRPGSGGYSIKQLERYYEADTRLNRKGLVAGGDQALLYFDMAIKANESGDKAEAARCMKVISDYNRDDCLSTKLLRDWLTHIPNT